MIHPIIIIQYKYSKHIGDGVIGDGIIEDGVIGDGVIGD